MTRATLLHVLDQPTALGPVEVRELEQLALAFPYCQTAHLLLAKAAHDQGTMLASQRLRRAATYAADRTLLRHLIEQVAPAAEPPVETPAPPVAAVAAPAATPAAPVAVFEPGVAPAPVAAPVAAVSTPEPQPAVQEPVAFVEVAAFVTPVAVLPALESPVDAPPIEPLAAVQPAIPAVATPAPVAAEVAPVVETQAPTEDSAAIEAAVWLAPEVPAAVAPAPAELPALTDLLDTEIAAGGAIPAEEYSEISPEIATAEPGVEPDLPAQAPAIRPPVEVGEARFEFGLAELPPPPNPSYELPGLIDEWAASAVTRSLGNLEALPELLAPVAAEPVFTPAAFTGDETVGYGFGESSRLGFSLQLLNLLATNAEAAAGTDQAAAEAQPPAAPLPPAGAFFEPDPLLLSHWAAHCPPTPVLPSSLDLINNFLRRQPRLTRPAMLPPSPASQTDLSVRSTRPEPDLASESLARILVRQGKTARAIEIYEKLMVKQPEKMAYFAAQIQQLQPPA